MITAIFLLAAAGFALAVGFVLLRRGHFSTSNEPVLYHSCRGCGIVFRYKPKHVGHPGKCPRCRETFTFPRNADSRRRVAWQPRRKVDETGAARIVA